MLKLSGWSRLTWGRDRSVRPPERGNGTRGPFGADPGTVRRDCSRGPVNHRSSRPPSPGPSLWANRELVEITGGHIPPPRPASAPWRDLGCRGGRRCVTPRQTCPRPDCFGRNLRSKTRWFTGFCNSHQVSHFATFFIDARAEISVAESRFCFLHRTGPRTVGRPTAGRAVRSEIPWRDLRRGLVRAPAGPLPRSVGARADWAGGGAAAAVPPPSRPVFETRSRVVPSGQVSTMILPQVHLRKPCYDFSFL